MPGTYTESFEKQWGKFLTTVKGKLVRESKTQKITYPLLNLLLQDVRLNWDSEFEENGRWLKGYKKANPEAGERIQHILLKKMAFTEITQKKDNSQLMNYVVPVIGAAAGIGISTILHANLAIKAVSTVVPAVAMYAATKSVGMSKTASDTTQLIDQYMAQLDTFKAEILCVLSEEK